MVLVVIRIKQKGRLFGIIWLNVWSKCEYCVHLSILICSQDNGIMVWEDTTLGFSLFPSVACLFIGEDTEEELHRQSFTLFQCIFPFISFELL